MRFHVTDHAVMRYQERLRPGLDVFAAKRDLQRLIAAHGVIVERPDWYVPARHRPSKATAWMMIGPDVLLPLMGTGSAFCVLTVVCSHGLSDEARAKRSAEKRRPSLEQRRAA